jgi:two-component system response regulator GlrR
VSSTGSDRTRSLAERTPPDRGSGEESVRQFRLIVVEGPGAKRTYESVADRVSLGAHQLNDLVLDDPTVSRFHCEIRVEPEGAIVKDLGSRNGTYVDGVRVREGYLRGGCQLRLGRAALQFQFRVHKNRLPLSERTRFGDLVGISVAMRSAFAVLERVAPTSSTVLLEGETGTGKGAAAEAIHRQSERKARSFVVVDCASIPANLLESELFGHERGAFTGATERRIGAFEAASGGTIFLDELGELPLSLQPKLLRVLESREIKRVGGTRSIPVDVRLIVATNRDLRAEVNDGRFRSDLYYRVAVVKIALPALRERPEDIPLIVEQLLLAMKPPAEAAARLRRPATLAALQRAPWPGNVRELRNYVERSIVLLDDATPPDSVATPRLAGSVPRFPEAKKRAQADFERSYLEALLQAAAGDIPKAARLAGVDRVYVYRLLKRHGMRPR